MEKKIIKILGTGCSTCVTTKKLVEEVIKENGIDAEVIKLEDIMEIMNYNVMSLPGIVINEEVCIKGRVPRKAEILSLLTSESDNSNKN